LKKNFHRVVRLKSAACEASNHYTTDTGVHGRGVCVFSLTISHLRQHKLP